MIFSWRGAQNERCGDGGLLVGGAFRSSAEGEDEGSRSREGEALAGATKRRVYLIDDHPVVRQGLTQLFNREADLTVCGEAGKAQGALGDIAATRPDILVLDISLNGPDGLDLLKEVRNGFPDLPVLVLSMHDESIYAERALHAGANGYIMKHEDTEQVLVALRQILNHEVYVSDRIADRMLRQYIGQAGRRRPLTHGRPDRP